MLKKWSILFSEVNQWRAQHGDPWDPPTTSSNSLHQSTPPLSPQQSVRLRVLGVWEAWLICSSPQRTQSDLAAPNILCSPHTWFQPVRQLFQMSLDCLEWLRTQSFQTGPFHRAPWNQGSFTPLSCLTGRTGLSEGHLFIHLFIYFSFINSWERVSLHSGGYL